MLAVNKFLFIWLKRTFTKSKPGERQKKALKRSLKLNEIQL
jgi:hypothetical protein